jgi:hypothetical protein
LLNFFSLLIINSNDIIFTTCCKSAAIFFIIYSKDIIVILNCMENLFSIFTNILIKVTICISYQKYRTARLGFLIDRSPFNTIDWPIMLLICRWIKLMEFFVGINIKYFYFTITISSSY